MEFNLDDYRVEEITDAKVYHLPGYIENHLEVYDYIRSKINFSQGEVRLYGKTYKESRLTSMYGDDNNVYIQWKIDEKT